MSYLDRIAISGIRSFGSHEQTLKFGDPLTIIVGDNGAGKTTIIESLRTITSGEYPPHTMKGKLFVQDPKLAGVTETKAQIKLVYFPKDYGKGQRRIIASRHMQLTNVKKQGDLKQTFKTRETAFRVIEPNGKEASLTNKCADAAKIFRQTLGVSKAVLENVIFCHQDEALWPFSD